MQSAPTGANAGSEAHAPEEFAVGFDFGADPKTKRQWIDAAMASRVDAYSIARIDVVVVANPAAAAWYCS